MIIGLMGWVTLSLSCMWSATYTYLAFEHKHLSVKFMIASYRHLIKKVSEDIYALKFFSMFWYCQNNAKLYHYAMHSSFYLLIGQCNASISIVWVFMQLYYLTDFPSCILFHYYWVYVLVFKIIPVCTIISYDITNNYKQYFKTCHWVNSHLYFWWSRIFYKSIFRWKWLITFVCW